MIFHLAVGCYFFNMNDATVAIVVRITSDIRGIILFSNSATIGENIVINLQKKLQIPKLVTKN